MKSFYEMSVLMESQYNEDMKGLLRSLALGASLAGGVAAGQAPPHDDSSVAWGQKVSEEFREKVVMIARDLGMSPDDLMNCMAFESGETFSSCVVNKRSGATGLIQFMPSTARAMGTTTKELAALTPEQQLDYVRRYLLPYARRMHNLGDTYMSILYPKGIGKSDDTTLFAKGTKAYTQNAGLDANKDGVITRGEAISKVMDKQAKGERFRNDPSATQPSSTPATQPATGEYIVKRGDNLTKIAKAKYGKATEDIFKKIEAANPGLDRDKIKPGQKIVLP